MVQISSRLSLLPARAFYLEALFFYCRPLGDDIRAVVVDWENYLRQEKLWSLGDPLFPATNGAVVARLRFEVPALIANIGAMPGRSEQYQEMHPNQWDCRTSISTALGKRLRL